MADSDSFETCPTDVIHASPERVWELLTNPALPPAFRRCESGMVPGSESDLRERAPGW
jgi:uncharacterized protein YndB with AHSA1/START domain